jgi:hypothetical protein
MFKKNQNTSWWGTYANKKVGQSCCKFFFFEKHKKIGA